MSWRKEIRKLEAAQRVQERTARKRQRELDRQLKEETCLSNLEQARVEVEAYENNIEVLLSLHHEGHPLVDWSAFASVLPPHEPPKLARHELAALFRLSDTSASQSQDGEIAEITAARLLDTQDYNLTLETHRQDYAEWEKLHSLAIRVLSGEARAYTEAVSAFSTFSEVSNLGSSIHVTVHTAKLVECELKVNTREIIPAESKSLTARGKLGIKATPKTRFNELYQDHVCSCVLRLAREILALLPVEAVLITATLEGVDSRTGHLAALPVLSVAIPRLIADRLVYAQLDPSDALENFQHRGDVMTFGRSGELVPITPLTPTELTKTSPEAMDFPALLGHAQQLRVDFERLLASSKRKTALPSDTAVLLA